MKSFEGTYLVIVDIRSWLMCPEFSVHRDELYIRNLCSIPRQPNKYTKPIKDWMVPVSVVKKNRWIPNWLSNSERVDSHQFHLLYELFRNHHNASQLFTNLLESLKILVFFGWSLYDINLASSNIHILILKMFVGNEGLAHSIAGSRVFQPTDLKKSGLVCFQGRFLEGICGSICTVGTRWLSHQPKNTGSFVCCWFRNQTKKRKGVCSP